MEIRCGRAWNTTGKWGKSGKGFIFFPKNFFFVNQPPPSLQLTAPPFCVIISQVFKALSQVTKVSPQLHRLAHGRMSKNDEWFDEWFMMMLHGSKAL
jgi:hypothetical protein